MSKKTPACIRLRGVRQNNLKNIDLDVPLRQLVVISGLSGSGKSSLAFETLFAEGQRRYIETFSPYARQFLDRMDKPQARKIEGIPPAIAIEQRNSVKSTRSTVGTMTEITDYAKLFWGHLARLHCRICGKIVTKEPPQEIWTILRAQMPEKEILVTFSLELSAKFPLEESLALIRRQGYQRLLWEGATLPVDQALAQLQAAKPNRVIVIQDRVKLKEENRSRFVEACEQAYHFGKGKLTVHSLTETGGMAEAKQFSERLHCATCDLEYREPSPALFSFNHPVGACPACKGFGRIIAIDYNSAIPDRSKTLAGGAVKPWQTKTGAESQADMAKFAKLRKAPMDVPFRDLPKSWQDWVIEGDPGYGQDAAHQWPRAWYGVKGYFRWLESKAYKMHVRVLLARYRKYDTCPTCHGTRFQPETLLYKIVTAPDSNGVSSRLTLADFYRMPVREALEFVDSLIAQRSSQSTSTNVEKGSATVPVALAGVPPANPSTITTKINAGRVFGGTPKTAVETTALPGTTTTPQTKPTDPFRLALEEVRSRLMFLSESGLDYLSLDRQTRSLSGGETERVNLTGCLGSRLVNALFVLDEPTTGLHPRDTARLVGIVQRLRDAGNTVVLVEHDASVMRAADQIIDLGPGHGESGGRVAFQGTYEDILGAPQSLTGLYLAGEKRVEIPPRRDTETCNKLTLRHVCLHNIHDLTVALPLGRLVCVTGVSGSGKSTLVRDVLLPALKERLMGENPYIAPDTEEEDDTPEAAAATNSGPMLEGWEQLGQVVAVDQSLLGRTPRSNPAVYIGAFDDIRTLFAATESAAQRGLNASAFSFNSAQGQCERCRGAGFEKIEMQFLSDIFIRCPDCQGRRYRPHILEVKAESSGKRRWNIADLLDATVDDAIEFLKGFGESRPAARAAASLGLLQEVGLGYVRLGQPINTLSGGESQRLKLVSHLALCKAETDAADKSAKPTFFIFDEPTTGLHFDDVRVLLKVFQRLVEAGHSVLVIEHNLDVIKSADWVIDLGPEGGEEGGRIVVQGTPEEVAASPQSHTGKALDSVLNSEKPQ